jgi:hypothetical protein
MGSRVLPIRELESTSQTCLCIRIPSIPAPPPGLLPLGPYFEKPGYNGEEHISGVWKTYVGSFPF